MNETFTKHMLVHDHMLRPAFALQYSIVVVTAKS
jgi:hypothetical protein